MGTQTRHFVITPEGGIREFSAEQAAHIAAGADRLPEFAGHDLRYLQLTLESKTDSNEVRVYFSDGTALDLAMADRVQRRAQSQSPGSARRGEGLHRPRHPEMAGHRVARPVDRMGHERGEARPPPLLREELGESRPMHERPPGSLRGA